MFLTFEPLCEVGVSLRMILRPDLKTHQGLALGNNLVNITIEYALHSLQASF